MRRIGTGFGIRDSGFGKAAARSARPSALLAALMFGWCAPGVAWAQGASAPAEPPALVRLTLADAIDRTLASSHRVGEYTSREDAARAALAARSAGDLPVFTVLAGYARTNHVEEFGIPIAALSPPKIIYPDVPDNWRARLDVTWPVYTSGRVGALQQAAKADAGASSRDVSVARAEARLDVARAFWNLATATEAVRVVEHALKVVDAHLRDVRTMRDVGLLAPNDVLSVEAQRSREQVLLIEAQNARDVAEADLRRAAGLASGTAIEIVANLEEPTPAPEPLARLLEAALANRPERQALELRISAFDGRQKAAAAGLKPTVALGAGLDYASPNPRIFPRAAAWNDSWDVSVNVAWPLWDGGRVKAELAEINASQRALQERLADFDRVIEFEVQQRRLDLEAARASIGAATDAVRSASEAHRVVTERFKAGLVTNTEVMDAQVALLEAEVARARSLAAARLAQARLERTIGR
ncbi:MAG: TolC family protein [Acidobacteriota bacterium]